MVIPIAATTHTDARRREAVRREVPDLGRDINAEDSSPRSILDRADASQLSPSRIAIAKEDRQQLHDAINDL